MWLEFSKCLLRCLVFLGLGVGGLNCHMPCCSCEQYVHFYVDFVLLQLTSVSVLPLCSGMSGFLCQSVPDSGGTEVVLTDSMIDVACTFDFGGEWGEQVTTAG